MIWGKSDCESIPLEMISPQGTDVIQTGYVLSFVLGRVIIRSVTGFKQLYQTATSPISLKHLPFSYPDVVNRNSMWSSCPSVSLQTLQDHLISSLHASMSILSSTSLANPSLSALTTALPLYHSPSLLPAPCIAAFPRLFLKSLNSAPEHSSTKNLNCRGRPELVALSAPEFLYGTASSFSTRLEDCRTMYFVPD